MNPLAIQFVEAVNDGDSPMEEELRRRAGRERVGVSIDVVDWARDDHPAEEASVCWAEARRVLPFPDGSEVVFMADGEMVAQGSGTGVGVYLVDTPASAAPRFLADWFAGREEPLRAPLSAQDKESFLAEAAKVGGRLEPDTMITSVAGSGAVDWCWSGDGAYWSDGSAILVDSDGYIRMSEIGLLPTYTTALRLALVHAQGRDPVPSEPLRAEAEAKAITRFTVPGRGTAAWVFEDGSTLEFGSEGDDVLVSPATVDSDGHP